ncbi:MAG: peptide chain release factor N(5)-glutamine methyltransferase [Anaerolineae bacterium]|nr:peptide chain release factor N(5)-glutamine methyltransferase [Anaerolineae bacterium]
MQEKPETVFNTIRAALTYTITQLHGVTDRPQLEAEILLACLLERERTYLLAHPEAVLTTAQAQTYQMWVMRRAMGEPLPYITGFIEFFELTFAVTPDVLIPRPETELLVEEALAWMQANTLFPNGTWSAVDVGTGSGCIAVALAVHAPRLRIYAVDSSSAALEIARANAQQHNVAEHVIFLEGDLLTPLMGPVDLIISNPPYIAEVAWDDLPLSVRQEPCNALLAGQDGLDVIRRLLLQARAYLRPGGLLLVEIGEDQGNAVQDLARTAFPGAQISVLPDLAGKDRVLKVGQAFQPV